MSASNVVQPLRPLTARPKEGRRTQQERNYSGGRKAETTPHTHTHRGKHEKESVNERSRSSGGGGDGVGGRYPSTQD